MWPTQTQPPTIPGADQLRDLNPAVAITLLAVIALLALLFYFGGTLRDRLNPKPAETPPTELAQAIRDNQPPVATHAVDRAAAVSDEYRDYLLDQIRELKDRVSQLERENERLRADVERYRFYPPPGWQR